MTLLAWIMVAAASAADPCAGFEREDDPFNGPSATAKVHYSSAKERWYVYLQGTEGQTDLLVVATISGAAAGRVDAGTNAWLLWDDEETTVLTTSADIPSVINSVGTATTTSAAYALTTTLTFRFPVDAEVLRQDATVSPKVLRVAFPGGARDWTLNQLEKRRWRRAVACVGSLQQSMGMQ